MAERDAIVPADRAGHGPVIFDEPMITRAFILGQRESGADGSGPIAIPSARRYTPVGWYPGAYRVSYDATIREYRIALGSPTARN